MAIWAEIRNAAGSMLGVVKLQSLTITRRLDAIGEISFDVPAIDSVDSELANERRVSIFGKTPDNNRRLLAQGIVRSQALRDGASSAVISWSGPDSMDEFKRKSLLLGSQFEAKTINKIVKDLLNKVGGWTAKIDGTISDDVTSVQFNNMSVMKALQFLAVRQGLHVRLGPGENRITFGPLGKELDMRMVGHLGAVTNDAHLDRSLILVETLELVEETLEVVNWVVPLAGGEGDVWLTLEHSTRTTPYTIQSEVRNGRTFYYLEDAVSIALYGQIERVWPLQAGTPLANAAASFTNAADALYDWAAERLARESVVQKTYRVSGVKVWKEVLPGDRMLLIYRGIVHKNGVALRYVDINEVFWVLETSESYGVGGDRVNMLISNVDKLPVDAADLLIDMMDTQSAMQSSLGIKVSRNSQDSVQFIDPSTALTISLVITEQTLEALKTTLTFSREDFTGPDTVSVTVDGVTVSGGPWMGGSGMADEVALDITDYIPSPDDANLRGEHVIILSCLVGSGNLTISIETFEAIRSTSF